MAPTIANEVGKRLAEHELGSEEHPCWKDCMMAKTVDELVAVQSSPELSQWAGLNLNLEGLTLWSPVIDGTLLKSQPIESHIDKPLILGSLKDEGPIFAAVAAKALSPFGVLSYSLLINGLFGQGTYGQLPAKYKCPLGTTDCTSRMADVFTDFLFTCPNRHYAKEAVNPNNVYMYFITQEPGFSCYSPVACICGGLACHGTELPFNFHTPKAVKPDFAFSEAEEALSTSMQNFWFNFAKEGKPNPADSTVWPEFGSNKVYHILNAGNLNDNQPDPYNDPAHCAFWEPYYSAARQKEMLQRMEKRLADSSKPKSAKKAPSAKKDAKAQ